MFLQIIHQRHKARPHSLHEKSVLLTCDGDEGAELWGVGCDGFLAEDVFSGEQGGFAGDVVVCVGRTYECRE